MGTVRALLQTKTADIWSIEPNETAYRALEIMADKDVGALLVIENNRLIGVFSERDYARKVILIGRSSKETAVRDLMTHPVFYVVPDMTLQECMALMTEKRVRHLPVLENGQLIGLVTIGDVVKKIISEQQVTIRDLENFITDEGYVTAHA